MKISKTLVALALSSVVTLGFAQTINVSVGGVQYIVSTTTGSYTNLSSALTQSIFYGNSGLAESLSNAVAAQLPGVYGEGTGPGFNYGFNGSNVTFPEGLALTWVYITGPGPQDLPMVVLDNDDTMVWALASLAGPSVNDTLLSFLPNAFALRNAFNLQSANIAQSFSYDCTVFDEKNICVSFSGTRSNQNGSNITATSGTFVIAHRPNDDVRFGGYINQTISSSQQSGLHLERNKPGLGAFVNFAMTSGLNVRGSFGYGKMDMQTTREAVESAEAGVGKSNITTQGAQLELSNAFDIRAGWTAVPYAGVRKVTNKRSAYSEIASDAISTPLSYADLEQSQTTAFGGIRFNGQVAPQLQLLVSAGFESDTTNKVDDYIATGVAGLGSISMQENVKKSRPVFASSLSYDIAKNERASIAVLHRQEAFDSKKTTSAGFSYTKGF